jgi:hypothetical protein
VNFHAEQRSYGWEINKVTVLGLALLFQFSPKILCIALATEIIFGGGWGKIRRPRT